MYSKKVNVFCRIKSILNNRCLYKIISKHDRDFNYLHRQETIITVFSFFINFFSCSHIIRELNVRVIGSMNFKRPIQNEWLYYRVVVLCKTWIFIYLYVNSNKNLSVLTLPLSGDERRRRFYTNFDIFGNPVCIDWHWLQGKGIKT